MLTLWRGWHDDQSPVSPTKGASNDLVVSPSLSSSAKPSGDPKEEDTHRAYSLLPAPDRVSTLSGKDFIVIFVEISMAYCNHVIRTRKADAHEYKSQLWKTRREIEIDVLFMQGWAALGSLLAGVLADGYIGNFYVALTSIVAIFLMATCLYVEQILIFRLNANPYAEVITEVASVAHLLNHSTGFSRVVFGLENMGNRKRSSVSLLLFIFAATGEFPISGGLLMVIVRGARMSTVSIIRISWWVSGISTVLFVIFFKSIALDNNYKGASRRAVRCFLGGCWHICVDRCFNKDWKDHVHRHYDKLTLDRVRGLVNYLIVLLPIAGYVFFSVGKFENLFLRVTQLITPTGIHIYLGITAGTATCIILTMILTYFLIMPGLSYIGYPKQFNYQFSLGYLFALISIYYVALVLKLTDNYVYDNEILYIRLYNARDSEVVVVPQESAVLNVNLTVPAHGAITWSYVVTSGQQERMLQTFLKFDEVTNFTTYVRAKTKTCISYAIADPPEMIRVTEDVPLFEGPPGTNDNNKPRIYLFNAARAFGERTIRFRDLKTGQWVHKLVSVLGRTDIFQVPPGKYEVWVEGTELHLYAKFNDGGLYGILLLADITKNLLELDTVVPGKELPSTAVLTAFSIFYGMGLTFSYIPLRIMTYTKAPSGLMNTCFAFLSAQENIAVWVLVVGYYTWHEQILANALLIYCFVLSALFFMSVFIMLKYNQFFA